MKAKEYLDDLINAGLSLRTIQDETEKLRKKYAKKGDYSIDSIEKSSLSRLKNSKQDVSSRKYECLKLLWERECG